MVKGFLIRVNILEKSDLGSAVFNIFCPIFFKVKQLVDITLILLYKCRESCLLGKPISGHKIFKLLTPSLTLSFFTSLISAISRSPRSTVTVTSFSFFSILWLRRVAGPCSTPPRCWPKFRKIHGLKKIVPLWDSHI